VPWLAEGHEISAAELDDAARRQGVQPEPGDIVMVRTGYGQRRRTDLLTGDGTEARPSRYSWLAPFHAVAMVAMGLWIVDNYDLENLAQTCRRLGQYEFMTTIAALRLKNSTGSPVNPLALF
jgi:hypothetical protein